MFIKSVSFLVKFCKDNTECSVNTRFIRCFFFFFSFSRTKCSYLKIISNAETVINSTSSRTYSYGANIDTHSYWYIREIDVHVDVIIENIIS